MITLSAISYNGSPTDPISASFDELGGSIGRADTNQMVLPDPDRSISRMHAQVVFRSGGFAIVDRGSNPVLVNGVPVGSGREVPIKAGDQVQIGGFLLAVKQSAAASAASSNDPFADLLGPAAAPRASGAAAALVDPLAAFASPASSKPSRAAMPPAPAPSLGGIPDDWDPFAPDPVPARPAAQDFAQSLGRTGPAPGQFGLDSGAAAAGPLIPDFAGGGASGNSNSLDALFGLKAGASGADPFADSLLQAASAKPNMASSHDPMQSLNSAPQASVAARQDDLSDLQRPFSVPPAVDSRPSGAPSAPPAPPATLAPTVPSGAVLSWDQPENDGRTLIRPSSRTPPAAQPAAAVDPFANLAPSSGGAFDDLFAPAAAPSPLAPVPPPVVAAPVAPAVPGPDPFAAVPAPVPAAPAASRPVHVTGSGDAAALLAAFRDGVAVPSLQIDSLTPELMRLIGQLLREAAAGTVDLLVARAALKREVRAEATMIVAKENNPLKFSPSAEVALQHLLSPPMRGFMPPGPAMRDAFDDLRAHQFGFIAGMRAALAGVLARFDPAELEGRLTQRSTLKSLLPGSRKAAMWEVFMAHYAQISTEAEDDFHSLFGKAFLKAYEEHIDQLHENRS